MILLHPSLRTSVVDGKLTSILKANTVANENAWLKVGWELIMEERAGHKKGHFHWGRWSTAGPLTFRSYFGRPTKCGSLGRWQGCSSAAMDEGATSPTIPDLSSFLLATWALPEEICRANTLFFSMPPMQGSETTNVLCFLLKQRFFPQGITGAWMVKWQKEQWLLKLCSVCSVPETYQVGIRDRLFLFSGHWVVRFEIYFRIHFLIGKELKDGVTFLVLGLYLKIFIVQF